MRIHNEPIHLPGSGEFREVSFPPLSGESFPPLPGASPFRANPEVSDERLVEIYRLNAKEWHPSIESLRAIWRDGCDAGMVAP